MDVNKQLLDAAKVMLRKAYKQNWQHNYPAETECMEQAIAAAEQAQRSAQGMVSEAVLDAFGGDLGIALGHAAICEDIDAQQAEPAWLAELRKEVGYKKGASGYDSGVNADNVAKLLEMLDGKQQAEPVAWMC